MAEPFKNQLGEGRIQVIANHIKRVYPQFDEKSFLSFALNDIEDLSLMERNRQIVSAFERFLPSEYEQAVSILLQAMAPEDQQEDHKGIHSWLAVPVSEYIGKYGAANFKLAMEALAKVTPFFSSEWGVRYLIESHQEEALDTLNQWCHHSHDHVRRLVSEGSRPRLPWGFQLKAFIQDPSLTFPLLQTLRDDESDYVRLSVSNHLNDISKDHPDWLQEKLKDWLDFDNPARMKLIRHACRTLIKQGHQPTLSMLGYDAIRVKEASLALDNTLVDFGDSLQFDLQIIGEPNQPIILDYAIHFQKSDGAMSPKVFKWKVGTIPKSGNFQARKTHAIKPVTTRRYYNGAHAIEILLNGKSIAKHSFELKGVEN